MNLAPVDILERPVAAPVDTACGASAATDLGEWGVPGISFGDDGELVIERDELGDSQSEAFAEVFARRRRDDAELVHLASISIEHVRADAGTSAGVGVGIAARRADRDVAELVAQVGLISIVEARRICRVARGITERTTLLGERLPADYDRVREAFETLSVPLDSAYAIIVALDEAGQRASKDADSIENFAVAEKLLVEFAQLNPADSVRKLANRWRDALDVDGIEPREEALKGLTSLHRFVRANGMKRYVLDADPLAAAYLDAVIDSHVGATIRRPRFDTPACDAGQQTEEEGQVAPEPLEDPRSIGQIAAEALIELARHGIACTNTEIPVRSTSIVVRMTLESLITGLGAARIDGIETPISARTARILAADAEIIPEVLGGNSEVLDFGLRRRLFGRAQRIALAERDGGCAFPGCTDPPSYTEAHHLKWWVENGSTDLANGILLCSRHHHRIHRDGWAIQVTDNVPWFIPPSDVDVTRTPRRGGRLPDPVPPHISAPVWEIASV